MGRGAGGSMPTVHILASELLGNTRADAPGRPGLGNSAFAPCSVVGEVDQVKTEDALDSRSEWYGPENLILDSQGSEIFVCVLSFSRRSTMSERTRWGLSEMDIIEFGMLGDNRLFEVTSYEATS